MLESSVTWAANTCCGEHIAAKQLHASKTSSRNRQKWTNSFIREHLL